MKISGRDVRVYGRLIVDRINGYQSDGISEWMETAFKLQTLTGHRPALSGFLSSCRSKQADGLCCCSLPLIWTLAVILLMRTSHIRQLHRAALQTTDTFYNNYRMERAQTIRPLKCNTTVTLLRRTQNNRLQTAFRPEHEVQTQRKHSAASNAPLHLHCNPANDRGSDKQSIHSDGVINTQST